LAASYLPTFAAAVAEADGGVTSSETGKSTTGTGASSSEPGKSRISKATGTSSISTGDVYHHATAGGTEKTLGNGRGEGYGMPTVQDGAAAQRRSDEDDGSVGQKSSVVNERVVSEKAFGEGDMTPNISILQRRGSLTRSVSVTLNRLSGGRRSSNTSTESHDFESLWEETQRRRRRRALMAVVILIVGLVIIVTTVSTRLVGRSSAVAPGINTDSHSPDASEGSIDIVVNETADIAAVIETEIYEVFEAEMDGICSDGPDGNLSPSSKARVEEALVRTRTRRIAMSSSSSWSFFLRYNCVCDVVISSHRFYVYTSCCR
jgi:hypothetical protein